jgi:hypothetical protein
MLDIYYCIRRSPKRRYVGPKIISFANFDEIYSPNILDLNFPLLVADQDYSINN